MKRALAIILSAVLLIGASGCGKKEVAKIGDGSQELTIYMHFFGYCVYNEQWPIFKKAEELTGVKLKGTASETVSDSNQAWGTMIVGKSLPDIIHASRSKLTTFAQDGGLIPLEDYLDKYAPNIKQFFAENPEAKKLAVANDGHIYFIPGSLSGTTEGGLPSRGWFIRKDWLNKLGLEVPKTVDELYNVLTAFKTKDPNGNGQADEIPYFVREKGVEGLFQLFGAEYTWYISSDGTKKYGKIEESYKEAVKKIAKWYKEGLIDQEIYSRGQNAREQLLSANLGGMTHDWFSTTGKYNDTYANTITGFEWGPIMPPADINGVVKEVDARSPFHDFGWGISKDCKDPETAVKYFDFWMSEKGRELNAYGVEGIHHTVVDGKRVFTEQVLKASEGVPAYMRNQGQVEVGTVGAIDAEYMGMNETSRNGFFQYLESGIVRKPSVMTKLTPEEKAVVDRVSTNINTYVSEQEQKWVFGKEDVDATWDRYIADLKKMGLDDYITVNQQAYAREIK